MSLLSGLRRRSPWLWAAPLVFLALFYVWPMASITALSLARGQGLAAPLPGGLLVAD